MPIPEWMKDAVRRLTSDLNLFNQIAPAGIGLQAGDNTLALVRARITGLTGLREDGVRFQQQVLKAWDAACPANGTGALTDANCNTAAGQGSAAARLANLLTTLAANEPLISSTFSSLSTP